MHPIFRYVIAALAVILLWPPAGMAGEQEFLIAPSQGGLCQSPRVAVNAKGNALIIWGEFEPAAGYAADRLYASYCKLQGDGSYLPGAPMLLADDGEGDLSEWDVAARPDGKGFLVIWEVYPVVDGVRAPYTQLRTQKIRKTGKKKGGVAKLTTENNAVWSKLAPDAASGGFALVFRLDRNSSDTSGLAFVKLDAGGKMQGEPILGPLSTVTSGPWVVYEPMALRRDPSGNWLVPMSVRGNDGKKRPGIASFNSNGEMSSWKLLSERAGVQAVDIAPVSANHVLAISSFVQADDTWAAYQRHLKVNNLKLKDEQALPGGEIAYFITALTGGAQSGVFFFTDPERNVNNWVVGPKGNLLGTPTVLANTGEKYVVSIDSDGFPGKNRSLIVWTSRYLHADYEIWALVAQY